MERRYVLYIFESTTFFMRTFIIISSILFLSCNNNPTESKSDDKDSAVQELKQDSLINTEIFDNPMQAETSLYVWLVDYENKSKKRNPNLKKEYLIVDTLIRGINEMYPNIKLDKVKMSGDTLFTKIVDSEYLVERIGSSGASLYIAAVVINLTSLDKIKYVKIDFTEGSHASPDTWSAKDFSEYKELR